jgi:uncharacterized protein (TIGR02145 family)
MHFLRFFTLLSFVLLLFGSSFTYAKEKTAWLENQNHWLDISELRYDFANQKLLGNAVWRKEIFVPIKITAASLSDTVHKTRFVIYGEPKNNIFLDINGDEATSLQETTNFVVLDTLGEIILSKAYNIQVINDINIFIDDLRAVNVNNLIIVFSGFSPDRTQLTNELNNRLDILDATLEDFGASNTLASKKSYVLVGEKNLGLGNAYKEVATEKLSDTAHLFYKKKYTENIILDAEKWKYTECSSANVCKAIFRFDGAGHIDSEFHRAFSEDVGMIDFSVARIQEEITGLSRSDGKNIIFPDLALSEPKIDIFDNTITGFLRTEKDDIVDLSLGSNANFVWKSNTQGEDLWHYNVSGVQAEVVNTDIILTYANATPDTCSGNYTITSPEKSHFLEPLFSDDFFVDLAGTIIGNPENLSLYNNGEKILDLVENEDYTINNGTWSLKTKQRILERGLNMISVRNASSASCPQSNMIYIDTARLSFDTPEENSSLKTLKHYMKISDVFPVYFNFKGVESITLKLINYVTQKSYVRTLNLADLVWQNEDEEGFFILKHIFGGTEGDITPGKYLLQITGTTIDTGDLKVDERFLDITPNIINDIEVASLSDQTYRISLDRDMIQNTTSDGSVIWHYIKFGLGAGQDVSNWTVASEYQRMSLDENTSWDFVANLPFSDTNNQKFFICLYTKQGKNTCEKTTENLSTIALSNNLSFSAVPQEHYFVGNTVQLEWNYSNDNTLCNATSSHNNFTGLRKSIGEDSFIIKESGDHIFTLSCSSGGKTFEQSVSIPVYPNILGTEQWVWSKFTGHFAGQPEKHILSFSEAGILTGKVWSQNWGWISFNLVDGADTVVLSNIFDDFGGNFLTGRAWSDSLGWIDFNDEKSTAAYHVDKRIITGIAMSDFGKVYFSKVHPEDNQSCPYGEHFDITTYSCVGNTRFCDVDNGQGRQDFNNSTKVWETCNVFQCDPKYTVYENKCIEYCTFETSDVSCHLWDNKPLPRIQIYLDKASYIIGDTPTISWNTLHADTCTAYDDWSGDKSIEGSEILPIFNQKGTFVYSITCDGPNGTSDSFIYAEVEPELEIMQGCTERDIIIGDQLWGSCNAITGASLFYKNVNEQSQDVGGRFYGGLYNMADVERACPVGYHVPSQKEWNSAENVAGNIDVLQDVLKIPLSGWYNGSSQKFEQKDFGSYYYSSDLNRGLPAFMRFGDTQRNNVSNMYASVRCINDLDLSSFDGGDFGNEEDEIIDVGLNPDFY